jgi:hypothetical protein
MLPGLLVVGYDRRLMQFRARRYQDWALDAHMNAGICLDDCGELT